MLIALLLAFALDDGPAATPPSPTPAPVAEAQVLVPPLRLQLPKTSPEPAQGAPQAARALNFVWKDHPSIRAGRNFRVDLSAKVQEDALHPGDNPTPFDTWQLARARAGVDGELFRKIQFSVEREFSQDIVKTTSSTIKSPWRDVYVELNLSDAIQIRGGKFKVPYGLDQTSGESNLDFVNRSLGGDYLSPGRDIGGMIHGRLLDRRLNYWAGGFQHDGDNSRQIKADPQGEVTSVDGGDRTIAVRLTTVPFRKSKGLLKDAEMGGSFATSQLSDRGFVPNGLRARTVVSQYTYFERMFVKGTRNRYGAELDLTHANVGARAEYMLVSDTRNEQGLSNEDLSNVRGKAWYVLATWVVTGEKKNRPVEARKGGLGLGGVGALELNARFDTLRFDSKKGQDTPFSNPRAETILPNSDKVVTVGFSYYANRWVKIQGNAIHEQIEDTLRSPTPSGKFWSEVLRLQFEL